MSIVKPLRASIYNVEKVLLKRAIFDPTQMYLEVDRGNLSEYNILNIYNLNAEPSELPTLENPDGIYSKWINNGKLTCVDKPAYYLIDRVVSYPDGRVFSLSCVVGLINIHKQSFNLVESENNASIRRRLLKTQQVGANIRALQVGYADDSHLETSILAKVKTDLPQLCLSTGKDIKLKVSLWQIPSEYNSTISDYYKTIDLTVVHDTTNYYTMKEYKDSLRELNGDHQDDTKPYDYSLAVLTNFQHQTGAIKMYIKAVHKKHINLSKLNEAVGSQFTQVECSYDKTPEEVLGEEGVCDKTSFILQIDGKRALYSATDTPNSNDRIVEKCHLYEKLILESCSEVSRTDGAVGFDVNSDVVSITGSQRLDQVLDNPQDYVVFYPCSLSKKDEITIIKGNHIYPHKTFYMDPPVFDGLLINNIIASPAKPKGSVSASS